MRRAFTLIELLVIIGIMGTMVTVSVMSVRSGQGAARTRSAARDVFAVIRHARSVALLSQQPAIITYSCVEEDGEPVAKVEITTTKVLDTAKSLAGVETLSGEPLQIAEDKDAPAEESVAEKRARARASARSKGASAKTASATAAAGASSEGEGKGQGVEDILFAPISDETVRGMRLKVLMGDEVLAQDDSAAARSKVSVFSTTSYLIGKFKAARATQEDEKKKSDSKLGKDAKADELQEEVSVVWETNGRVDPHTVYIYPDGAKPEDGLSIKVDRFGAAKVLGSGEKDD